MDEIKAKAAHDIWAHWMKYFFTQTFSEVKDECAGKGSFKTGNLVIGREQAERWKKLMNTEFEDLTEKEQKSDYEIAKHYLCFKTE